MKKLRKFTLFLIGVMLFSMIVFEIKAEPQKTNALPDLVKVGGVFPCQKT
ncbi:MAG: hypothetical protein ACW98F_01410 [Candidatus Hodarchaeales archaeon]|jgi:hypothetical protein